ncbi:mitochondrial inner membrane protein OXA1-like [Phragmites australis]|uniref:mitochondrial inner membrane protein OXA1-like n=1 Tax=Phragmites australis TaxID=29695 RepID=UPI002D7877D7|nr:mitochondrial inner membrane protein OXA1-like [Phragmites australis]
MAVAARRSFATRLSHHLTRRLNPCVTHALTSHSHDDPPSSGLAPLPLPRTSGAARTLSFLPFSLHLAGPTRRSFSSAPDPAPPADVDAAGVLVDAADAVAVSVPAPFPGEVAAAAAESFLPVAALQHLIDAVHTFTGLNWWACIALTTLMIRSATVPLLLNQLKATTKLNAIKPEMEAIKDQMNAMDPKSAKEGQDKMKALFQKHGVSPFTPLKGLLIQGPIFMSFFFAISNMVEKVPSLKGGGTLWFTDLTTPDSLYIFPVLTGLTFLATVELNLQEGMEGNSMAGKMKNFSRGMAFMTVPFTMNFAKAIFCYWITSNMFSLVYGIVIRRPAIRKLFNLPALVAQPSPPKMPTFNLFGGSKAIPAAESPVSMRAQQSALGQPDAAALGYRVQNLEKKAKSKGKSQKRR